MSTTKHFYGLSVAAIVLCATALFVTSMQPADAATCTDGKKWRYIDRDKDKLGDPNKDHRICRQFPKEGYVSNKKDEDDTIAQFEYDGLTRGWVKITLEDSSYYKFRAFNTFKEKKKKVKMVRFYKNGTVRNRLITLHPRGKSISFVNYWTGFAEDTEKLSKKKWSGRFLTLNDFNEDGGPEVVVALKKGGTVKVIVVRYVTKAGFTVKDNLKIEDAADVAVKNTTIEDNQIALSDIDGNHLIHVNFDPTTFTLSEAERMSQ